MNSTIKINEILFNKFPNQFIDIDYPTEVMQFTGNVDFTSQCAIGDLFFITAEVLISNKKGQSMLSSVAFYWNPVSTCYELNFSDKYILA